MKKSIFTFLFLTLSLAAVFSQDCNGTQKRDYFFENHEDVHGDTIAVEAVEMVNPCYFSPFEIHRRLFVYREGRRLHYGQSGDIGYSIEKNRVVLNQRVVGVDFLIYQLPKE